MRLPYLKVLEQLPEFLLDRESVEGGVLGALEVVERVHGVHLAQRLHLHLDHDGHWLVARQLQRELQVEERGRRDVVEPALEPAHAPAQRGPALRELQQQLNGLLRLRADHEHHAERVAVEHLVQGRRRVAVVLRDAPLDLRHQARLAFHLGVRAEQHDCLGHSPGLDDGCELLHFALGEWFVGLERSVERVDERLGRVRGLHLGHELAEQRQVGSGRVRSQVWILRLDVLASAVQREESARVERGLLLLDGFLDGLELLLGCSHGESVEAVDVADCLRKVVPELQEQFGVVRGECCVVLRGGEARQNELAQDQLELAGEHRVAERAVEGLRLVVDHSQDRSIERDLVCGVAEEALEVCARRGSERMHEPFDSCGLGGVAELLAVQLQRRDSLSGVLDEALFQEGRDLADLLAFVAEPVLVVQELQVCVKVECLLQLFDLVRTAAA